MSSKKIFQQFIKKTASEGKSIVAWDESRRYEGVFKQFDPTGEFVILTNVWVSEGQETIFVSEMLLPLNNLTIVSAGLPVESFEQETYEEFGTVYPSEVPSPSETFSPATSPSEGAAAFAFSQTESAEKPVYPAERPEEPTAEVQPPVDLGESKLINLPTTPSSEAPTEPIHPEPPASSQSAVDQVPSSEPPRPEKFESASEKVGVMSESKKTASQEVSDLKEKAQESSEEKTAPMERVRVGFGKLPAFFQKVFKRKPKDEYPQDVARKIPPTPAYRFSQPRRVFPSVPPRPSVPVTSPLTPHPQAIQRRSAQVSTSSFFAQPVPTQAPIPKQKVDIGTLILDILIGILTLVVIAIVAMGFLGIKIPSLPF